MEFISTLYWDTSQNYHKVNFCKNLKYKINKSYII